jgi:hypothetical protein
MSAEDGKESIESPAAPSIQPVEPDTGRRGPDRGPDHIGLAPEGEEILRRLESDLFPGPEKPARKIVGPNHEAPPGDVFDPGENGKGMPGSCKGHLDLQVNPGELPSFLEIFRHLLSSLPGRGIFPFMCGVRRR